jgi:hypothetical protein
MNVILGFAPLIVFPIVSGFYTVETGLWAALLAALVVVGFDLRGSGSVKILNLGTVVLFALLAFTGALLHPVWNELWVRLAINAGFLAIVLFTLAIRSPFTLQYAREETPKEFWNAPVFVATNYRITWVWAGAFLWSVAIDLIRIFVPAVPAWLDSTLGIAALVAAGIFTGWYPKRVRARSSVTH